MFGHAPMWLVAVEVVLFTLGGVAFAVALWLGRSARWRQMMAGSVGHVATALAVVSLIYCACNVVIAVRGLTGRPPTFGLLTLFTVVTYQFPPLIITDKLFGDPRQPPVDVWWLTWLHRLTWLASAALSTFVVTVYLGLVPAPLRPAFFGVSIGLLFLVAFASALAVDHIRARHLAAPPARPEGRWVTRLFGASIVLTLTLLASGGDVRGVSYVLSLTTRLLPVLFLAAGAYADGRAAFYDLLVKRLTLTALAMVVLVGAAALLQPVVAGASPGTAALLTGVLLAPLVLALLAAGRALSDWLDARWLGRRVSPGDAVEHLLAATRPMSTHDTVRDRALVAVGVMCDATADLREQPPSLHDPAHVAVAPVNDTLWLAVTRRDVSRRFYSEDLALVRAVARVLGLELDRITLEQQRQAEASRALRAQVNPHFLFNALNAIGGWMRVDAPRAEAIIEDLSGVFRYTLRGTTSDWLPLGAELDAVAGYLAVERARFGTRLSTALTCEATLRDTLVPPLVVLTLVENAIKHGVATSLGPVEVRVLVYLDTDGLRIDVVDTGEALDEAWADTAPSAEGGFGLASVRARLHLLCGPHASLQGWRDADRQETCFSVRLPLRTHPTH